MGRFLWIYSWMEIPSLLPVAKQHILGCALAEQRGCLKQFGSRILQERVVWIGFHKVWHLRENKLVSATCTFPPVGHKVTCIEKWCFFHSAGVEISLWKATWLKAEPRSSWSHALGAGSICKASVLRVLQPKQLVRIIVWLWSYRRLRCCSEDCISA